MKHLKRISLGVTTTMLVAAVVVAACRCQSVRVDPDRRLATYETAPYDTVLAASVHDGLVDYAAIRADHQDELDQYLDAVARFGPATTPALFPAREDRLAYYINAYNAIMLRKWLDAGAGRAGSKAGSVNVAWFFVDFWLVDGSRVSLDTLEQKIIRPRFKEPRVHFALVCGAMSCPPLLGEAFEGGRLDEQLDGLGRRWLTEPDGLVVNEDGSISMSSIFTWYRGDFDSMNGLTGVLERYLDESDPRREAVLNAARSRRIRFMGYDWSINRWRGDSGASRTDP